MINYKHFLVLMRSILSNHMKVQYYKCLILDFAVNICYGLVGTVKLRQEVEYHILLFQNARPL